MVLQNGAAITLAASPMLIDTSTALLLIQGLVVRIVACHSLVEDYNTPTIATLEAICSTLNITLADFFAEDELVEVDSATKELLLKFKSLPEDKQQHILKTIDYLI